MSYEIRNLYRYEIEFKYFFVWRLNVKYFIVIEIDWLIGNGGFFMFNFD